MSRIAIHGPASSGTTGTLNGEGYSLSLSLLPLCDNMLYSFVRSSVCDCGLEGTKFFYHDDKLFCVTDFQKEFSCASCGLHISDAVGLFFRFSLLPSILI